MVARLRVPGVRGARRGASHGDHVALSRPAKPLPLRGAAMRLRWGSVGAVLLAIAGGAAVLTAVTRTGRYLVRAAWEEGKILRHRRSIADLVKDPGTDAVTRGKLQLVLE